MSPVGVTLVGRFSKVWVCTGMNHSRQRGFSVMFYSVSSERGKLTCCLKRSLKTYRQLAIINIYYLSKGVYVQILNP